MSGPFYSRAADGRLTPLDTNAMLAQAAPSIPTFPLGTVEILDAAGNPSTVANGGYPVDVRALWPRNGSNVPVPRASLLVNS